MKRLTLVAATVAFLALVAASYAEVQSVRLSGELRLRGYWTSDMDSLDKSGVYASGEPSAFHNDSKLYFQQRTRVTVEWDMTDHVLVVATLQAEAVWGTQSAGNGFYPATGSYGGGNFDAQHADSVELVEGYVRFTELFWTPLNLQIGRQGLDFGNGLILSNNDKEYRFDAARFTWDELAAKGYSVDFIAAKLATRTNSSGSGLPGQGLNQWYSTPDGNMFFANIRWEPQGIKFVKDIEFYAGYLSDPSGLTQGSVVDAFYDELYPSQSYAYVWLFGFRGDLNGGDTALKPLKAWWEISFEAGQQDNNDAHARGSNIAAYMLDIGASWTFDNVQWKPVVWADFTQASGDTGHGATYNASFRPWFDYGTRGGVVLKPILTNINILAFGVNTDPTAKWMLGVTAYDYWQNRQAGQIVGNPFVDNGGIPVTTNNADSQLGWEFDFSGTYNYSKDVKASLILGWFMPGQAYMGTKTYTGFNGDLLPNQKANDALELRGEIEVKF